MNVNEIKNAIKEMFDNKVDGVTFMLSDNLLLDIKGFSFTKKVKLIESKLGNYFHILLYRFDSNGNIIDVDLFESILTGPEVYIENLIKCGFLGLVVKKTKGKHSLNFIKLLHKNLLSRASI